MRVLVIGAGGHVGKAAAAAFAAQGHEVIEASRSGELPVDLRDEASIAEMYRRSGKVDAVVSCTGSVPFKPLSELKAGDYRAGFEDKVLGQVNLLRLGLDHVSDGGSFTFTTGVLAREPIPTGAAASLANGALEAFVMAAAAELPRGLRINAVSPGVLEDAPGYHPFFPGFEQVPSDALGRVYVKSAAGIQTGRIFALG
ncbi:short chain dehydrogenase [Arthrobacter sp. SW1]|uniref:short chain dehydrogenase n=1 Tax=Arthrobacter sp. SW1 TaxID=1920889 RepID=UPI000877CB00|nr:short chain dehydrogenase [Arthrobacter sp. SW1]OFI39530.1 short chain dehydrogenase [Arthrobacter sp. SW1]